MSVFFMDFDMAPSVIWARDLYDQMQIQSDFRKWFPRMCQYGFVEGRDYEFVPRVRPQDEGGRTVQRYVKDYRITLEMAKQLYVEPEVKEEPVQVIEEEEPTEEEKIPFTIAGNGEVEDNITDDSSKEFFTVKTKGGNTFFLVIDRARNSENVYMLSMIDEYDLQEFLTDEERNGKEEEEPAVVLPETKPEPEPDVEIEEPEQDDGKLTKMEKLNPDRFRVRKFGVSDVIVTSIGGKTQSYYVNPKELIKFNGFFTKLPNGEYLLLNEEGYQVEGQKGTWTVTDEKTIDEQRFVLMVNDQKPDLLPSIVVQSDGKFITSTASGFDNATVRKVRDLLHHEKFLENGTAERARESGTEQNYNMIDGCVNNVPKKPRVIGGRVSVLDRLHIKQAERARKDNAQVQQQERTRKN